MRNTYKVASRTAARRARRPAHRRLFASTAPLALVFAMAGAPDAMAQVIISGDTDPLVEGDLNPGVDFYIGVDGFGSMRIEGGAAVSNGWGSIGVNPGGEGEVTVTGEGSTWSNSGELAVGNQGTGKLTIEDGGHVINTYGNIGAEIGNGEVLVTGDGSYWENTANLNVGNFSGSIANLRIEDGGRVTDVYARIGGDIGSEAMLS